MSVEWPSDLASCGKPRQRPFGLDPLLEQFPPGQLVKWGNEVGSCRQLAYRLTDEFAGVSHEAVRQRVYRWRRNGLTVTEADAVAAALGRYPSDIWTEWWQVEIDECREEV